MTGTIDCVGRGDTPIPENDRRVVRMTIHTKVLTEIPQDAESVAAWNDLVLRMERPEVFFTCQWALAVSKAFHQSFRPLLFLMYDSDKLAGVAALARIDDAPGRAFFLASNTADYCDVVSAPERRRSVLVALLHEAKKMGIRDLELANIPADSATLSELAGAARACNFQMASRAAYNCWLVELGDEQQRESFLAAVKHTGKRHALKKLAAHGRVTVAHLDSTECVRASTETMISAQVTRFLASGRISPFVHEERREFLRCLSAFLGEAGWLKVSELAVNGRAIAWNFGFRFQQSWFWYLPTFQLEYEGYSPGFCLLRLLLEDACRDSSVERMDLGLGDEPYKERFSNGRQQTRIVQLSASSYQHAIDVGNNMKNRFAMAHPAARERLSSTREVLRRVERRLQQTGVRATLAHGIRATAASVVQRNEVLFFEAAIATEVPSEVHLQLTPLTWSDLNEAAMSYANDSQAAEYLLRCAGRLRKSECSGFGLRKPCGSVAHVLWVRPFVGFHLSEIDYTLSSEGDDADMIFDCWTPPANKGMGYYAAALRRAARMILENARRPWIFASASNRHSQRGIVNAGFTYRYSLAGTRIMRATGKVRRTVTELKPLVPEGSMKESPVPQLSAE